MAIPELEDVPIVIGAPYGHTNPIVTLPIGGTATLEATTKTGASITVASGRGV